MKCIINSQYFSNSNFFQKKIDKINNMLATVIIIKTNKIGNMPVTVDHNEEKSILNYWSDIVFKFLMVNFKEKK